jgi:hypothetical protein
MDDHLFHFKIRNGSARGRSKVLVVQLSLSEGPDTPAVLWADDEEAVARGGEAPRCGGLPARPARDGHHASDHQCQPEGPGPGRRGCAIPRPTARSPKALAARATAGARRSRPGSSNNLL